MLLRFLLSLFLLVVSMSTVRFQEGAAPGTPDTGFVNIYTKTDGIVYKKASNGVEVPMLSPGGATGVDNVTIEVSSSNLRVKDLGISTAKLADAAVTAAKLAAAVAGNGLSGGAGTALAVNVDDSTIEINTDTLRVKDLGISTGKIADSAVTAAKIANRTRKVFIPITEVYNQTDSVYVDGHGLPDAKVVDAKGYIIVPADYDSAGVLTAVIDAELSSGDCTLRLRANYHGIDESGSMTTADTTEQTVAVPDSATKPYPPAFSLTLTGLAANDILFVRFTRNGADGADTLNDTLYLAGFVLTYTADS